MAVAKVILNDVSQIDLTSDTVTAESLLNGYTAHDASGTQITGTATGGGDISGNIADFLAFVPAFDDTWSTTEFSILSYPSSGYIEVPHSLGEVPSYAVVLKTDITLNDIDGIIGGYNFIGGAKADSALNRNIRFGNNSGAGSNYEQLPTTYKMGIGQITNINWSFVGSVCPDWTAEKISFRIGNSKNTSTGFCLGQYILGVKKVQ